MENKEYNRIYLKGYNAGIKKNISESDLRNSKEWIKIREELSKDWKKQFNKFCDELKEELKYEMVEKEHFISYSETAFKRDIIPIIDKKKQEINEDGK